MRGLRKECNELTVEEILYLAEQGYEFIVKGGLLFTDQECALAAHSVRT